MLQNVLGRGQAFKDNKLTVKWIENYSQQLFHDPVFVKMYDLLIKEIKENRFAHFEEDFIN